MMAEESSNIANSFDTLKANLQLVIDQLRDGETANYPGGDFTLGAFWERLGTIVKAISHEASKMCMAFSSPPVPTPEEYQPLIKTTETATLALVATFYSLPKTCGVTLQKVTKGALIGIIEAFKTLVTVIQTKGHEGSKEQLSSTGNVWECCDNFTKIPKNNRDAVVHVSQQTAELVNDALQELEEAQSGEDDGWDDLNEALGGDADDKGQTWSEEDKKLLAPAMALVKATKGAMKKVIVALKKNGSVDSQQSVQELDSLATCIDRISPMIDDFSMCLYPPMKHDVVTGNSEKLVAVIRELLEGAKHTHISTEDDSSWLEFLLKALDHNLEKIQALHGST